MLSKFKSKKGIALQLETVIIFIIILAVLILVIFLISKFGGSGFNVIRDAANNAISAANNTIKIK